MSFGEFLFVELERSSSSCFDVGETARLCGKFYISSKGTAMKRIIEQLVERVTR